MGGLGLRRLEACRNLCWAASFSAALPHLEHHVHSVRGPALDDKMHTLRQHLPATAPTEDGAARPCVLPRQRDLLKQVDQTSLQSAIDSVQHSPALQAWITSNACSESSVWLVTAG